MNLLEPQNRIRELLSVFVTEAKASAATGMTDFNRAAETVLIPLFKEVYGYTDLENLNSTEGNNFPGIDLGDKSARVAFQVTGTPDSDKIKDTLQKVVDHQIYDTYSRIIIYIITEKQKSYSGSGYAEIIQDRFDFDKERDILDYRNVLKTLTHFQIDKLRRIENILEANFGDKKVPLFGTASTPQTESVFLNLLEVSFPQTLYMADVLLDMGNDENQRRGRDRRRWRRRGKSKGFMSNRERIRAALEREGVRFAADWEYYNGKIITFHDLEDRSVALRSVLDEGTIEALPSSEFYDIDDNYERVFKSLLRRCLQQKLHHMHVAWQHEEGKFIFSEVGGQPTRMEGWHNKRYSEREVYARTMKSNKPDEILKCKHLAFEVQFRRFGEKWYVAVTPDWFFSYDGYNKSYYCSEDIKWLKRNENNEHVAYHARFIAYYLKSDDTPKQTAQTVYMFDDELPEGSKEERTPYPYLSFGEYVTFDDAPFLPDKLWRPSKKDGSQLELGYEIV
jgi:hypothetical protein